MKPEQAFGIVLREIRNQKNLSQERLALNCNLDRTFISLLERGQRQPSLTSILLLSKSLEVPATQLIGLTLDRLNENSQNKNFT